MEGFMSDTGALVYVVDDDVSAREGVARLIRSAGLRAETFASAQEFLARPRSELPSCLVLDVEMPGLSGLDLQTELAKADVQIPIIFLTGHGNIPMTVRAIKAGALEFLTKPFDDEDLLHAIRQANTRYQIAQEHRNVEQHSFEGIIGTSAALKAALNQVECVAPTESTVLILGETGTGKELIARAVRKRSHRYSRPFVKLNCAAIPFDLLESELFGHERGAFTGAIAQKVGRFELADKGTLFLDEVGDIPLALQPKLLRVLQEQEFERLGSGRTHRVDVRLVAATHRDLEQMVKRNEFRSDLYYRLNVFPVLVPPLRARREDIPALVAHFVDTFSRRMGKQIEHIPEETLNALNSYSWPGNIRELQNVIERSVILSDDGVLPNPLLASGLLAVNCSSSPTMLRDSMPAAPKPLKESEREFILQALETQHWVLGGVNGAAAKLGLKRTTLIHRMKKLGIERPKRQADERELEPANDPPESQLLVN
jgi:DNA-binding NtrC family response regulator